MIQGQQYIDELHAELAALKRDGQRAADLFNDANKENTYLRTEVMFLRERLNAAERHNASLASWVAMYRVVSARKDAALRIFADPKNWDEDAYLTGVRFLPINQDDDDLGPIAIATNALRDGDA